MSRHARKRRKTNNPVAQYVRPTEAREAHNDFQTAGMAYRVVPVIDSLLKAHKIAQSEYDALAYYREQAHKAEDDCATCGTLAPQRMMGGERRAGDSRIPASLYAMPALLECARIERELGQLRDIARAIAVDDLTLSRWCIAKHGGRERYDGAGKFVAMVPIAERENMRTALLELRFAARRIRR